MIYRILLLFFLCHSALSILGVGRQQSIAVRGKLQCNGMPYRGALIKLYDADTFGKDDRLASMKTGPDGMYQLGGHAREMTSIDPKINIYHDCNDGIKPCQRKFTIKIPDMYITNAKNPQKVYDAGSLELAGKFGGESRDCIH